jgi:hypothetical protein
MDRHGSIVGFSEGMSQIIGEFTSVALSIAFNVWGSMAACFAAGTPLLTPEGEKPIEEFKPGDWVLSAPEGDPEAAPEPRQVEEVFVNYMPLWHVQVGGRTIQTTSEHPFYVRGKGWTAAKDLQPGVLLRSHDGQWVAVESMTEGEVLTPLSFSIPKRKVIPGQVFRLLSASAGWYPRQRRLREKVQLQSCRLHRRGCTILQPEIDLFLSAS